MAGLSCRRLASFRRSLAVSPPATDSGSSTCISHTAGRYVYHEAITADFVYLRLHGSRTLYASLYTEEELKTWAEKLHGWNLDAYVYFDNDFKGHAVRNALPLKERLYHF